MISQVSAVGESQPRSWDDLDRGCLSTFHAGIDDPQKLAAGYEVRRTLEAAIAKAEKT